MRSPLAYPLNRSADMDAGGAADLQTDIMRFMAILSLCLVAIFALVQSLPMTPAPAEQAAPVVSAPPVEQSAPDAATVAVPPPVEVVPAAAAVPDAATVTLTRPKWVSTFKPREVPVPAAEPETQTEPVVLPAPGTAVALPPPAPPETEGFTLRFESDAALTRLVAASTVGLYAIDGKRAQRMTVSESRISFWDASTPNTFHEMQSTTVPAAVVEAHARSGAVQNAVSWGVTLPGKLKRQLDELMQAHPGGVLVITANGNIRWEAS
ncbi:MAG: hypothetical protein HKN64_07610 [Woeseiaceae bacterium]|nr:hypothetical protein [Woeseiaceae bacterium]